MVAFGAVIDTLQSALYTLVRIGPGHDIHSIICLFLVLFQRFLSEQFFNFYVLTTFHIHDFISFCYQCTMCPGSSYPNLYSNSLYKLG